jgi:hypothetical protein
MKRYLLAVSILVAVAGRASAAPHWVPTTAFTSDAVLSLAATPSGPRFLLASTNQGIFRSSDGGDSWTQTDTVQPNQPIVFLGFDPSRPRTVYGCIDQGSICDVSIGAFAIDPQATDDLFVAGNYFFHFTGGGDFLLRRPHAGGAWSNTAHPSGIESLAVEPGASGSWFALTCSGGLYRRTGTAGAWRKVGAGLPDDCAGTGARRVRLDPRRPGVVYVAMGDLRVFASTDGGRHFEKLEGVPGLGLFELLVDPFTSRLYAGVTGRGVFQWLAHRWQPLGSGLPDSFDGVLALDAHAPGTLFAAGADGTVYRLEP